MGSRGRRVVLAVAAAFLLLAGGRRAAGLFMEALWYESLGYERIFWLRAAASAVARLVLVLLFAGFLLVNLRQSVRSLGAIRIRRRYGNIEIAERLPDHYLTGALLLASLLSAWLLTAGLPEGIELLAALRPARWGVDDPLHGIDLSFYVLRLPLLELLQSRVGLLVLWAFVLAAGTYAATGAIQTPGRRLVVAPPARRHLGLLAAGLITMAAADLLLDRYRLAIAGGGVGGAPGYADAAARAPVLFATALVGLAAAAAVGVAAWRGRRRPAIVGLGALGLAVVATAVVPALVQRFVVEPDEFRREAPFLRHHLRFARLGFGLDGVRTVRLPYQDSASVSPAVAARVLARAPLWDPRPLLSAYRQTESLYRYYGFHSVASDRYAGEPVGVAVRELFPERLPSRSWQNLHLIHTSGSGAVASPMARSAADGSPAFFLRDIDPPRLTPGAPADLALQEAAVYVGGGAGEGSSPYVVVPDSSPPLGVRLGGLGRRGLAAWAFGSMNLLLSPSIGQESRIVYRRTARERVLAVAPFLMLPPETPAQPVIAEGRVVWVVDGYTATRRLPFSPLASLAGNPVRYARNSVKATVDAATGEVRLYGTDSADPILRTYDALLPGLLQPVEEMPAEIRAHLRYPAALLATQAEVLGSYHLPDPRAFYAKDDVWVVATEKVRDATESMDPTYALLPLPGGGAPPEFLLTLPLVAQGPQNLRALLVARNDPHAYGEILVYQLPRNELVLGPQQVEAQIDQDAEISQQLSLWKEGGSQVLRGHLLVVPVDSSLLYLEPVYLEAESNAIPQLQRVILATPDRVVMRRSLAEAVEALLGGAESAAEEERGAVPQRAGDELAPIRQARRIMERAEAQLRAGDWSGFGESWATLRRLLGGGASGSPPAP